jgi:hypothetical protein
MLNLMGFRVCSKLTTFQTSWIFAAQHMENQLMSALGQKPTCAPQKAMSALPRIATAKADFRKRRASNGPRFPIRTTGPHLSAEAAMLW